MCIGDVLSHADFLIPRASWLLRARSIPKSPPLLLPESRTACSHSLIVITGTGPFVAFTEIEGEPMTCPRCHGLMVAMRLEDAESSTSCEPVVGWRCLLCGEVIDHEIKAHRQCSYQPAKNRARPPSGIMLERRAAPKRKEARR